MLEGMFRKERVYSKCCVWVKEEGAKMIKQVLGRWTGDVSRCWLSHGPTYLCGLHDIRIWCLVH